MNTFAALLKREFWEHKGGFFWAPIIAVVVNLTLTLMAAIAAEVLGGKAGIKINGVHLIELGKHLDEPMRRRLGAALDVAAMTSASWPYAVLGFVVFFYCLGALFDDRRDRSVLFWKSLPISDRDTVLSKVFSALVTAPLIATAAAIASALGMLVLFSAFTLWHGGNPFTLVWGPASPLKTIFDLIATLPVYMVWALPTVGWLLLCSAWAKSKPFLWAVILPVLAGVLISWFDLLQSADLRIDWFWGHVVGRLLGSTFPGMNIVFSLDVRDTSRVDDPSDLLDLFSASRAWGSLLSIEVWIGAALGVAMIVTAIRLRRWRDEG